MSMKVLIIKCGIMLMKRRVICLSQYFHLWKKKSQILILLLPNKRHFLVQWLVAFLLRFQVAFNFSERATECIIRFLAAFFTVMSKIHPAQSDVLRAFPTSLYKAKLALSLKHHPSRTYVVCGKCHKLYEMKDCIDSHGHTRKSHHCSFVEFRQHPQRSMRQPCGEILLKSVEGASKKLYFYPFLTYCYLGMEQSLQFLLGFYESCQPWRTRCNMSIIRDVYDSKIWTDFQKYENEPFLQVDGMLALMMNMDFFQPYRHITYSIGLSI